MVAPKVELISKWRLEEEQYHKVVFKDLQTGATAKWPRIKKVKELVHSEWLDKVVDPASGFYYPKRDEGGKPSRQLLIIFSSTLLSV